MSKRKRKFSNFDFNSMINNVNIIVGDNNAGKTTFGKTVYETSPSVATKDATSVVLEACEADLILACKKIFGINAERLWFGGDIFLISDTGKVKNNYREFGSGLVHTLDTLLKIYMHNDGGVLLFDDFPQLLHYSRLEDFWGFIADSASNTGCTLLFIVQSLDHVESILEAFSSRQDMLSLFRLDREKDGFYVTCYSYDDMLSTIDFGLEVR